MQIAASAGSSNEEITPDHVATQAAIPLVTELVASTLNCPVWRVTPYVGMGSVNLILFVESQDRKIVVRLSRPEDDSEKMRREYEKERWCISYAATAGVPGPEVLAVGEFERRAFMLQQRVPGVNGKQSNLSPEALMRIVGRYLRLVHNLPANGFGDSVEAFEGGDPQEGWRRFVDYNLGELTDSDPLMALGVYTGQQQNAVRDAFTWLRSLPRRVGLNHGDPARRNTIVGPDGRVTLLDWGCAEMHLAPHYDINALLTWYRLDNLNLHAFLDGYGISNAEWKALLPELRAFALLKAFDLTRWALDRCQERTGEIAARAAACMALLDMP
jgi:aminoglycoside phosphotransferase (APT) family kinase protein